MRTCNLHGRRPVSSLAVRGMVAFAAASVVAANVRAANIAYSLTPADATFSGINWTTGATVPGAPAVAATSGDALYFGGAPAISGVPVTTLNNDLVGATYASLTFNSGTTALTINNNAFTLGTNITNSSTALQTINTDIALGTVAHTVDTNTGNLTLGGTLSGAAASATLTINKSSAGILTLSGANTYTGTTRVNAGTLRVTGSLADTSLVTVAGGTYDVAASDTVGAVTQQAGTISGVGTLTGASYALSTTSTSLASVTLAGSGTLTKSGSGVATLSGANTYTGLTTISAGTLSVTGSLADTDAVTVTGGTYDVAASDTVGVVTFSNGSTVSGVGTLTGTSYGFINTGAGTITSTVSAKLAGGGALNKTGSGISVLSGADTYTGGTTITGGTLSVTGSLADTGAVAVNGGVYDVAANDTVGAVTLGNATISGVGTLSASSLSAFNTTAATIGAKLGGSGSLSKTAGSGTLILSGANSYSGGTTQTVARIQITNASALGTGTVTQSGGATLELNLTGTNTVTNTFNPFTPGTVTVSGNTITTAATPTILNTAGINTINSNITQANATGGSGLSIGSDAGLLTIAGNVSNLRTGTISTLALGGAGAGVVSGGILNATATEQESVVKYGAGTWTLTGPNTYATTTSVLAGTLVTGSTSALGTSAVGVTNAGTDLKVGNGTVNTVGGLTGLTMADSTVLDITALNSQLALTTGTFVLGNITLNLNGAFSNLPASQSFILIDGVDGANSIGTVAITGTNPAYGYTFGVVGNDGVLSVTATPEPTTLMALGLGGMLVLRRRRRA